MSQQFLAERSSSSDKDQDLDQNICNKLLINKFFVQNADLNVSNQYIEVESEVGKIYYADDIKSFRN